MDPTLKVNYDFSGFFLELQSDSRSFVNITFRQSERYLHRSLTGYETLIREKLVVLPSQFQFDLPSVFTASEESCRWYVYRLLSEEESLDGRVLHRLVSEIPAAVAEIIGSGEAGGRAFMIGVDIDVIHESLMEETEGWNKIAVPLGRGVSAAVGGDGGRAEEMSCAVCLEEISGEVKCMELPCSHVFHRDCVSRWLRQSQSCPLCRGSVS